MGQNKDIVHAYRSRSSLLTMEKAANLKRRANLLYQLRRKGVRCDTGLKLIFIPYESNPFRHPQVMPLCKEYHFNIQFYWA